VKAGVLDVIFANFAKDGCWDKDDSLKLLRLFCGKAKYLHELNMQSKCKNSVNKHRNYHVLRAAVMTVVGAVAINSL
jgi:hypothetical protein